MKYTKEQRREIYYYCMLELEYMWATYGHPRPICLMLNDIRSRSQILRCHLEDTINIFHEFLEQKPKGIRKIAGWWNFNESGYISRMNALSKAIELTYK